jgi:arsenate reductase
MSITIYHNQDCSNSCGALNLLQELDAEIHIVNYINHPPTKETIAELLDMLQIQPLQLIRTKEAVFQPYLNQTLTNEQYIALMVQYPVLIQRPIVIKDKKAIIGRPPELILTIL